MWDGENNTITKSSGPIPTDAGSKFDSGKPPITLIPKIALENEAQVFAYGANKYGKNNWKLGLSYSRLLDASLRHILAFSSKEDLDIESGLSHLAHARAGLAMMEEFMKNGGGNDDR